MRKITFSLTSVKVKAWSREEKVWSRGFIQIWLHEIKSTRF